MIAKTVTFLVLLAGAILLWFANLQYPHPYLERGFYSLMLFSGIFLIFKILLEEIVARKISEAKSKYLFKKSSSFAYLAILILAIITVWVPNPEALLVAYGVIAAGIAIAIQDLFKNIAGGLILLFTGVYTVGDRIEVNDRYGDVVDIGLLYTTLLEIREWVDGDQATGRLSTVPNYHVLSGTINNYTKGHDFIWDEIKIPITYASDWKEASRLMTDTVGKETKSICDKAKKEMKEVQEKYYFSSRDVEPKVFITLTDNWIELSVRYVSKVRERRELHASLSRQLLEKIEKSKKVRVASATVDIVGFPEPRSRKR